MNKLTGTTHYTNNITVNKFLRSVIIIKVNFIHLQTRSKRRLKSRRYNKGKKITTSYKTTILDKSSLKAGKDQPGKVANPVRGQLNREN